MERRNYPRVPLDAPLYVSVRFASGCVLSAMLVDIGRGGVQVAFSPEEELPGDLDSDTVLVENMPTIFDPDGGGQTGFISWVSLHRCGIRFTRPLRMTEEEIASVAAVL